VCGTRSGAPRYGPHFRPHSRCDPGGKRRRGRFVPLPTASVFAWAIAPEDCPLWGGGRLPARHV
jgi:hypothetical protein